MRKIIRAAVFGIPLLLTIALVPPPRLYAESEKGEPESGVQAPAPKGSLVIRTVHESDFPALAKVSLQQAISVALGQISGGLLKAETEEENGSLVHQVEIVSADKSIAEFTIDGGTGSILKQSVDQPDTETHDEHEGEDND